MGLEVIEFYTWNILKKQLQKFKVSNIALYNIINNVKEQISSMIANWKDLEFRNALLILGSEEGTFYEPKNDLIANMVVVTIRNSLLEGISSISYREYGSSSYLDDSAIKEITSEAIKYFSKIDLETLSANISLDHNFYKEIADKYPTAIKALIELAKCTEENREHDYVPLQRDHPFELEELNIFSKGEVTTMNCESGIDASFNSSLCQLLKNIQAGKQQVFLTDCFKMCTRNFEKLLKILEVILTHHAVFLTSNYLLLNGYVARRKNLIKAAHTEEEFLKNKKHLPDISEKYKQQLLEVAKQAE